MKYQTEATWERCELIGFYHLKWTLKLLSSVLPSLPLLKLSHCTNWSFRSKSLGSLLYSPSLYIYVAGDVLLNILLGLFKLWYISGSTDLKYQWFVYLNAINEIYRYLKKPWVYLTFWYLPRFNHIIEPFNAFALVTFGRQSTQLMQALWDRGSHVMLDVTKGISRNLRMSPDNIINPAASILMQK